MTIKLTVQQRDNALLLTLFIFVDLLLAAIMGYVGDDQGLRLLTQANFVAFVALTFVKIRVNGQVMFGLAYITTFVYLIVVACVAAYKLLHGWGGLT